MSPQVCGRAANCRGRTMANFDPNAVTGLIGLWDFRNGAETADTGLDDGIAQNGHFDGHGTPGSASGDRAHFDGSQWFDVNGDNGGPAESAFDLSRGTIETQFTQDVHVGSSPDTIVNRGEFNDMAHEGWFGIQVTHDGKVIVQHCPIGPNGTVIDAYIDTPAHFFSPGDTVNVKYSWDAATGASAKIVNTTTGATFEETVNIVGLTLDIGDNDDEIFTFGAREVDDGHYNEKFDGSIDYVAVYKNNAPDAVDDTATFTADETTGFYDSLNLLDNDSDTDGDTLTVTAVNGAPVPAGGAFFHLPDGGIVYVNSDGRVDFGANGDFDTLAPGTSATTGFTYTISDGKGGTDTATATFTVESTNTVSFPDGVVDGEASGETMVLVLIVTEN